MFREEEEKKPHNMATLPIHRAETMPLKARMANSQNEPY